MDGKPYDASNYLDQVAPSMRSADVVLPLVFDVLEPESVLDVGCGGGGWLAAARRLGINDIVGIEAGDLDGVDVQIPLAKIVDRDLRQPIRLGRAFDLVISVEVAEHIPATSRQVYVETLAVHADAILFSAAVPGQGGHHHVNEQWPDYWSELFSTVGFACFDPWRLKLWDNPDVEWWYRQNLLMFARGVAASRLEQSGFASARPSRLVHPDLYLRNLSVLEEVPGIKQSARSIVDRLMQRAGPGQAS
jgi:SAM-dependent methyltransferase